MSDSILIENFGPIKKVEIQNIRKITVFIGESGSGKSTIMKMISLFRWIYKMLNIRSYLKYSGIKKSPFRFSFTTLIKNSGMAGYFKEDTVIKYQNGSCVLEWDQSTQKLKGTTSYIPKGELSLEKIAFISDKRNLISDLVDNNASIKKDMFYASETYFDFETAVREVKEIDVLDLGVRFVVKKTPQGLKYVIVPKTEDNNSVKLNEASSGTQNVVPMNVIVEYYSKHYDLVSSINNAIFSYVAKSDNLSDFKAVKNVGEFSQKRVHLIIEEPELSLFPSSQRELIDFLVSNIYAKGQSRDYNMSLMIATHSPYIVNYLNVLLRRDRVKDNKKASINTDDIAVYRIYEGENQNLIAKDNQTEEIIVNTIDLGEEMDFIYNEYVSLKNE